MNKTLFLSSLTVHVCHKNKKSHAAATQTKTCSTLLPLLKLFTQSGCDFTAAVGDLF